MSVVEVPRATLRSMRSLVGGIAVGIALLLGAVVMLGVDAHARCEAGNEFRRETLPAAFAADSEGFVELARDLGASPEQIEAVEANGRDLQATLDQLFPRRECNPW